MIIKDVSVRVLWTKVALEGLKHSLIDSQVTRCKHVMKVIFLLNLDKAVS